MLTLIGIGLWDERDLTLEGFEILKKSDKIYLELYTSKWHGSIKNLEKMIGKKIHSMKRSDLEENSQKILEEAKTQKIFILILGDPLVATTHITLLLEAKRKGIKTRVIHNTSIYSAVAETGLHLYKFGATVTLPFPEKTNNQQPESVYETIHDNKQRGLHTLCLLDLVSEKDKFMIPNEGMKILLKSDNITEDDEIIVFGRAGSEEPLIICGKIKNLIERDFGNPPFVLIIPGKLHFTEKEYLDYYRAA
ncbi:MAG: diphthine synthase [Candidatus Aenigmarchaeota archaeon]|nr:diphthine synthase [Candidatus Aenigmarchaeota archaeon]